MKLTIHPVEFLRGELLIPGDKSISHRAIIFTSLAKGRSRIQGFLESEDCLNTLNAFRLMGVEINKEKPGQYQVNGKGLTGLQEPVDIINCGNSGTCMRLLTGLLAAQPFISVLTGDKSLRSRPMDRIILPLEEMGAEVYSRKGNLAPLCIKGKGLRGIEYSSPVASAQVKSALLLAGLFAEGDTRLSEPASSRDHTERMLQGFGVNLFTEVNTVHLKSGDLRLQPQNMQVPGDISSAAFFLAAGLIVKNSEIILKEIGINPTRSGILKIIEEMGGRLDFLNKSEYGGEPISDILVKDCPLKAAEIRGDIVPKLIDEIPIIALLASQAEGETIIRDAAELRVKETDRVKATVNEFQKLGIEIEELPDGMIINGPAKIKGGVEVESYGDHRMAMTLAVAGLIADDKIIINDSQSIKTSFPEFTDFLSTISH